MALNLPQPIIYLITTGATTRDTTPDSEDFRSVLDAVSAAAEAHIPLVQLREKNLTARTLYELAARSVEIARGTGTRILVNDRADLARAAGADGVHLTTKSLEASVVRRTFGQEFLIGVSAHSQGEAREAQEGGADFAVFGPVFDTPSKRAYGPPVGLEALREVAHALNPFPLLALGGITLENSAAALRAGARGVGGISLFADAGSLKKTAGAIRAEATGSK
ncbi:MAG TPA: thiamine phosphate synthase [Pyrinomonadaceae bacterium]|nr:thiamine phosphate synthase [Pyrinomonadaceae bacterium]